MFFFFRRRGCLLLTVVIVTAGYYLYKTAGYMFLSNTVSDLPANSYIYIRTGTNLEGVIESLKESRTLSNTESFRKAAVMRKLMNHIHAGRYRIEPGMSNLEIISLIISGRQEPLNFTFSSMRSIDRLADAVSKKLEADSAKFMSLVSDSTYMSQFGFTTTTAMAMFIPNTYQFYWNTGAEDFLERMYKEYKNFWNEERMQKLGRTGMNLVEVSILASIIENETNYNSEKPRIAGVYINRLHKGMPLQADPTIKFAINDWTIKRVLREYLKIESPYNTYKYAGLPPGPICIPSISSIDAVLDFEKHNYLYFCAAPETGLHEFSSTFSQHTQSALKYRRSLNKRGIKK